MYSILIFWKDINFLDNILVCQFLFPQQIYLIYAPSFDQINLHNECSVFILILFSFINTVTFISRMVIKSEA